MPSDSNAHALVDARTRVRVGAIVLAAGASTRMGAANKLLLDVGGTPMVRRICAAALASRARPVIVVTGHEAELVRSVLGDLSVALTHNEEFAAGMSTSIRRGIDALPTGIDGALFVLGDMPWVEARHLDALIDAFSETETETETSIEYVRARICAPSHQGRRGNPVLWGARYLPELRELRGDRGARALLERHSHAVKLVETDDGVIVDIDTASAAADALDCRRTGDDSDDTSR